MVLLRLTPAQKNENGDEKKQANLSQTKVGDFDESKVYAIFDMLIANGQLTLPPCKRPAKIEKVYDSNYLLSVPQVVGHTLRQSFLFLLVS